MIDIEQLHRYGIVCLTISVKKCDYTKLFDDVGWKETEQRKQVKQFYKYYDDFKRKKK